MSEDPMWAVVMFDLPVQSKAQRSAATRYRNLLKDLGFQRVQYSVYARYSITAAAALRLTRTLTMYLPEDGEVRMLRLTDKQWATAFRFINGSAREIEEEPDSLLLF